MRVLQVAHNHPRYHPGGTELFALALHRAALAEGLDSWFLGAVDGSIRPPNPGTSMIGLSPDQREAALWVAGFDRFALSQPDSYGALSEFAEYLALLRPDVVHVHHVLNFGLEAIAIARAVLPDARIVLTLHDYYLVCANHGQLFQHAEDPPAGRQSDDARHGEGGPHGRARGSAPQVWGHRCPGPEIDRCARCIPGRSAVDFALRARDVAHVVGLVDRIVAPSNLLKAVVERAAGWGARIEVIENGYIGPPGAASPPPPRAPGASVTFGSFGNLSRVKGVTDLLAAARLLAARGADFQIRVHGAQLYPDEPLAAAIADHAAALGPRLVLAGGYRPDETAALMEGIDAVVFPSLWYENSPLVIYEALHHGRPVVAYPHGGAPEILTRHGKPILAARSDVPALADAMERVMREGSTGTGAGVTAPDVADIAARYRRVYGARLELAVGKSS